MADLPIVTIYTDGACSGNPGPGGWGAILVFGTHEKEIAGGEPNTTNNRMELQAALEALKTLKVSCHVHLYTDSRYLQDGMNTWVENWSQNGWKTAAKKDVKNVDLWQALMTAIKSHKVDWHWVKGHDGHEMNERADALARNEIMRQMMLA